MKKRLMALLLCVVMVLTMVPGTVFATESLDMEFRLASVNGDVDKTVVAAGDTISVELVIKKNPGIDGLGLDITFSDNLKLTAITNAAGTIFSQAVADVAGKNYVWYSNGGNDNSTGVVATLAFTVKEGASGDVTVSAGPRNGDAGMITTWV